MDLKIKTISGNPTEKKYAQKLLPILTNHHLLLTTLMLWNAFSTETLPIFLNKLIPEYVAIILSVTLILLIGEILPASILMGPQQLKLTSNLVALVYLVRIIFFPVSFPISKALDLLLGNRHERSMVYNKNELITMLYVQNQEKKKRKKRNELKENNKHIKNIKSEKKIYSTLENSSNGEVDIENNKKKIEKSIIKNDDKKKIIDVELGEEEVERIELQYIEEDSFLHDDEAKIITGALTYRETSLYDLMIPLEKCLTLSVDENLGYNTLYRIYSSKFSIILIYSGHLENIVSTLCSKDLIFVNPIDNIPVRDAIKIFGRPPKFINGYEKIDDILSRMKNKYNKDEVEPAIDRVESFSPLSSLSSSFSESSSYEYFYPNDLIIVRDKRIINDFSTPFSNSFPMSTFNSDTSNDAFFNIGVISLSTIFFNKILGINFETEPLSKNFHSNNSEILLDTDIHPSLFNIFISLHIIKKEKEMDKSNENRTSSIILQTFNKILYSENQSVSLEIDPPVEGKSNIDNLSSVKSCSSSNLKNIFNNSSKSTINALHENGI